MKRFLIAVLWLALLASPAGADEVVLKNGTTVSQPITERSDKWVKVDVSGVTITYYNDEIESINGKVFGLPLETAAVTPALSMPPKTIELSQKVDDGVPVVVSQPSAVKVTNNPPVATTPTAPPADVPAPAAPVVEAPKPAPAASAAKRPDPGTVTTMSNGVRSKRPVKPVEAIMAVLIMLGLFSVAYLLFVYPVYLIAKKLGTAHPYFAFIPVLNFYLMVQMAGRPMWWLILFFVPLVNIVVDMMVWMDIAVARKKPAWLGILVVVPFANLAVIWYLALVD